MPSQLSMKTRLVILGLALSVLPIITYLVITFVSYNKISALAAQKTGELAHNDLNHIIENLHNTCIAQHGLAMQIIENALKTSENILADLGDVVLREDKPVKWEAINQYTKVKTDYTLPSMFGGDTWFGQNKDMNVISPIVDKTRDLSVETCTIFQRMNDKGDMLRVVTNVEKLDGKRAIGTFIPAVNPDGSANPVVSAVLNGKTFLGRAFVVNAWYLTAYKPLYDKSRNIIGILYVGIKQKTIEKSLASQIKRLKIGNSGNVFVLNSKAEYVVEPENLKLPEEKLITIISETKAAAKDETVSFRFPSDSKETDYNIIRARYFEKWDWIISVNVSENELMEASVKIAEITRTSLIIMGITALVLISLAVLCSLLSSTTISKKLLHIVDGLSNNSSTVSEFAAGFTQSSRILAEGSSGQAASIEEISSSMEEMSSMTRKNAENSSQADELMKDANHVVNTANESMDQLTRSMEDISKASEKTSKIIKTIDEIAFQTNLLALNAAVEAARAGEAGAGFAVVADEVRNLAMRAANAAKDTSDMIQGTVKKIDAGTLLVSKTNEAFSEVAQSTAKVGNLVSEISQASIEQSTGIEQVNSAIAEMDNIIQQNTAETEETALGSKEMNLQVEQLNGSVRELVLLVLGSSGKQNGNSYFKAAIPNASKPGHTLAIKNRMIATPRAKEIRPDQVIPFDDQEDF